jgi:hypothetical protein
MSGNEALSPKWSMRSPSVVVGAKGSPAGARAASGIFSSLNISSSDMRMRRCHQVGDANTQRFLPATATPARLELHRLLGGILSCGTDNGTDALDGGTLRVVKEVCVSIAGGVEISRTIGGAARCQTTVGAYNTRTDGDRSGPQRLRAGAAID